MNKETDQINRRKTDFLSDISHEIRTPLNVIIGMCDIAINHIDEKEKVEDCLRKISMAGDHITELVNNLLDITKVESVKDLIKEQPFNIETLTYELNNMLEPLAEEKNIVFRMTDKYIVNKEIISDYSHLMQVMINLGSNAIKYTPKGGFIEIEVSEWENKKTDMVTYRFECQDTGIGMSEDFLKHIFDPFVRADDSRVNEVSGSGLGMSIVKKIIEALNGTIDIKSYEGTGTKVTIEMEFKTASGVKTDIGIKEFMQRERKRLREKKIILVAEDMKYNREVLVTYLEDLGYEVVAAQNGEAVVDMFMESQEGYFKAILMDIEMPVMNGYQATLMIRGLNRSDHDIPIIAMTANAMEDSKKLAKKVGMNDYLTKPYKMECLRNMLSKWI